VPKKKKKTNQVRILLLVCINWLVVAFDRVTNCFIRFLLIFIIGKDMHGILTMWKTKGVLEHCAAKVDPTVH
jgi:hypothetical protein